MVEFNTLSTWRWATVRSALPTFKMPVAEAFRLEVRVPRATTAITAMATAAPVSVARSRRAATLCTINPMKVTGTSQPDVPTLPSECRCDVGPGAARWLHGQR